MSLQPSPPESGSESIGQIYRHRIAQIAVSRWSRTLVDWNDSGAKTAPPNSAVLPEAARRRVSDALKYTAFKDLHAMLESFQMPSFDLPGIALLFRPVLTAHCKAAVAATVLGGMCRGDGDDKCILGRIVRTQHDMCGWPFIQPWSRCYLSSPVRTSAAGIYRGYLDPDVLNAMLHITPAAPFHTPSSTRKSPCRRRCRLRLPSEAVGGASLSSLPLTRIRIPCHDV